MEAAMRVLRLALLIVSVLVAVANQAPAQTTELVIGQTPRSLVRFGDSAQATTIVQSFLPTAPEITAVSIRLARRGAPAHPIGVSIRASLTGPPLSHASITPTALATTASASSWSVVEFPAALPVEPGRVYYLALTVGRVDSGNFYYVVADASTSYPTGTMYIGTTVTKYDALLKIHQRGVPPPPPPIPIAQIPPTSAPLERIAGSIDVGGRAYSITIAGDLAYVGTLNGLSILDLGPDPAAPGLLGSIALGDGPCQSVEVQGSTVYLACTRLGLVIVDASNRSSPRVLATHAPHGVYTNATAVAVKGHYAFLSNFGGWVHVYNVSEPGIPHEVRPAIGVPGWGNSSRCSIGALDLKYINQLTALSSKGGGKATHVSVSGDSMIVTECGYGRASHYDVSDPENPMYRGSHYFPFPLKAMTGRNAVYMLGAYAKFSGLATAGLPWGAPSPQSLSKFVPSWCEDGAFVKTGHPSIDAGGIHLTENAHYVVTIGGQYEGTDAGILEVYYVGDPLNPLRLAGASLGGATGVTLLQAMGIATRGDYIYTAAGNHGVQVWRMVGLGTAP
jgi:hypothetical protein